jgi:hypothetical protein
VWFIVLKKLRHLCQPESTGTDIQCAHAPCRYYCVPPYISPVDDILKHSSELNPWGILNHCRMIVCGCVCQINSNLRSTTQSPIWGISTLILCIALFGADETLKSVYINRTCGWINQHKTVKYLKMPCHLCAWPMMRIPSVSSDTCAQRLSLLWRMPDCQSAELCSDRAANVIFHPLHSFFIFQYFFSRLWSENDWMIQCRCRSVLYCWCGSFGRSVLFLKSSGSKLIRLCLSRRQPSLNFRIVTYRKMWALNHVLVLECMAGIQLEPKACTFGISWIWSDHQRHDSSVFGALCKYPTLGPQYHATCAQLCISPTSVLI